ncbi:MAG: UDP-N-acetylglucosamine 4,6-dehydratase (inverting) [Candidatus Omnitrophica bacterium]|nr:UDP-N-acetylglucosamine 4,6-dehydratase (inverting) [Candidatus Omnitrophota bacterium]
MEINGSTILITGGTGSFGNKLVEILFDNYKPKKVIVFSRDEFKQYEMAKKFSDNRYPIRYFLGDIRDRNRLERAFDGVDYVVHAAALKQVPALEYNPTEAVKTNVIGADNIVHAAIEKGVKKVVALSTDKAVSPTNLYGATKLVAEKTFIAANEYGGQKVQFSVVRYGNVMGSRGSVIPLFLNLKREGIKEFPITDERMTRFWITLDQSVELVLKALQYSVGGENFIPIIPSMRMVDLALAIEPEAKLKMIGIRPGEKIHETLISEDESRKAKIFKGTYVILPQFYTQPKAHEVYGKYKDVKEGFVYKSDTNDKWLSVEAIRKMLFGAGGKSPNKLLLS